YLKQAWTLLKQNRLFSGIYVVGTGLSIALVMTLFIIYYVKFAPIYPEYNRNRTLVIKAMKHYPVEQPGNISSYGGVYFPAVEALIKEVPHIEAIAGLRQDSYSTIRLTMPDGSTEDVAPMWCNAAVWKVFNYRFLSGQSFTEADEEAKVQVAVLSRSLAMRLFATTDATGRTIRLAGNEYRVVGVVEDTSNATPSSAAELWLPIGLGPLNNPINGDPNNLLGNCHVYILAEEGYVKEVQNDIRTVFERRNKGDNKDVFDPEGQPDTYWVSTFRVVNDKPDMKEIFKSFGYILLALIFIPALNLGGMISSRMDQRLAEVGVRKAFGGTNRAVLQQVLTENLLLTCLGGLAGLLFSYLIVFTASDWIFTLFDTFINNAGQPTDLTFEMLFNPWVFGSTFLLCLVLNLLSAYFPARNALKHSIIQSLNTKR
ncbi:MAG: ABC transporter permease, partial [Bacteroides sp.]